MIRSDWKLRLPVALFGAALAVSGLAAGPAAADGSLVVRDFVLTNNVVDREPTNEATSFTIQDKKAFVFARLKNTGAPTAVNVVWHHEGTQHGSVWLNVGKSPGWRTWSSANLKTGDWSVSLVDAEGSVLMQRSFTVGANADAMAATGDTDGVGAVSDVSDVSDLGDLGDLGDGMVEEPTSAPTTAEPDEAMFYPVR